MPDEYGLCQIGGAKAAAIRKRLKKHRRTFITRQDFAWLKQQGITAVRIPVGHWVFGNAAPYAGTVEYLDKAFEWAEAEGIDVLVCLHGAPGSQNGEMHSGRQGTVGWNTDKSNMAQTLEIISQLAHRYKNSPRLWGIELLNEPAAAIPKRILKKYYQQAYRRVRQICGPEVRVVINDIWRPKRWCWPMHWPIYQNVWFDTHQYQIFSEKERNMNSTKHVAYTRVKIPRILRVLRRHHHLIIGEWSAALDMRSIAGLDAAEAVKARQAYFDAQLYVYGQADGWFYWTYKMELNMQSKGIKTEPNPWSYRSMRQSQSASL